jgi:hypothetical protein
MNGNKTENARAISFLCFGSVFLILFSAIILLTRGWLEQGIVLLAIGIALLPIAIAICVALGKTRSPSTS